MQFSQTGLDFLKQFEGLRLSAYKDSGGIYTIGYGTTRYPNGYKVQENDTCTEEEANQFLLHDVQKSVDKINKLYWQKPLSQNQFDALVSFEYNTGHLVGSTLYKKASENPSDQNIYKYDQNNPVDSCQFLRWVRVNGIIVKGLINRRKKEADLYSKIEI